jgi:antitoxin component of RelBE/YafQ-DinJ toxin-antitoxin module
MKTQIIIKADKDIKNKAQKTAKELGIPLSVLINAYLKQLIVNKEAHFYAMPKMTSKLEKVIRQVKQDAKKGKNLSPVFDDTEDLLQYLHSQ